MGKNIVEKIIGAHLVSGEMVAGEEVSIKIDQTLTQDATGTMAYLQLEAMGIKRVKTKRSVSYIDHNTLQSGFENADDHLYLQSVAAKFGIFFSRPGNGICHQVHMERFGVPGQTLLGSDSHTPTAGGIGMLAIGAGGLDVAVAMGGAPFYLTYPKVVKVNLTGKLKPWVSAKDVILELLRRLSVKGGVGKIFEYGGPGAKTLSVPERSTITNMGAELGATTSLFLSDEITKSHFVAQERGKIWKKLEPDKSAEYDDVVEIDLSKLEPLIACPHSPDKVKKVADIEGTKLAQVAVGSCTNSSFHDLMIVAKVLKGKTIHPSISFCLSPGSNQVLSMVSKASGLTDMINAGVRMLENACGPCIGMGQAPPSKSKSLRSFNRNFEGRTGTANAGAYLASPEVCAASALTGKITDPRRLGKYPHIPAPKKYPVDDRMVIKPPRNGDKVKIYRGPNIKPLPINTPLAKSLKGELLLKVGDNITTDHIMPAGAKILPLRSNIPSISEHVFVGVDPTFPTRAKELKEKKLSGFIIGGENYGQGSSREHAALAPMYLGIKAVLVKSFARIHLANLINFGIIPMTFDNARDFDQLSKGDKIEIPRVADRVRKGLPIIVKNASKNLEIEAKVTLTDRQKDIILAGGLLNYSKSNSAG